MEVEELKKVVAGNMVKDAIIGDIISTPTSPSYTFYIYHRCLPSVLSPGRQTASGNCVKRQEELFKAFEGKIVGLLDLGGGEGRNEEEIHGVYTSPSPSYRTDTVVPL